MNTKNTTLTNNNRIEIADVLRGFVVMGITLIHFIERFSLNSFPEETCNPPLGVGRYYAKWRSNGGYETNNFNEIIK
jgi:uncharacterized membrane protein